MIQTFGNKKVTSKKNGEETNIINKLDIDSTFLQLDPGEENNVYRYDADENLINLEVTILYNPLYLSYKGESNETINNF